MQFLFNLGVAVVLVLLAPKAFSAESINLLLLPDPFSCHQVGIETAISSTSRLGLLGVINCSSERPTYGGSNSDVRGTFSRFLIPWTYSNRAWQDGYFLKTLVGVEQHEFTSNNGSRADVTFFEFSPQIGYQWFWNNGFNVSASVGIVFLVESGSKVTVGIGESQEVIDFLNKNTTTNQHLGFGVILGWLF